ncbi:MAG: hypothetical protein OCD01_10670 [Fibrobacterales bacterium]
MKYDDFTLEQYLLGDLSEAESTAMKKSIADDSVLQQRIALLEQNNHDLRERFPYATMEGKVRQKRAQRKSLYKEKEGFAFTSLVKGVLVTLMVVFGVTITYKSMSPFEGQMMNDTAEVVRIKGLDAQLNVYKKTRLGSSLMRDSMVVSAGDEFQLEYVVTEQCHGVILSIDGNGAVTYHLAKKDGGSVRLDSLKRLLPFSYQLDDAPRYETFYMVLRAEAFEVGAYMNGEESKLLSTVAQDTTFNVERVMLLKGK